MRCVSAGRAVVVGSGIAGLTTALHLGHCTIVTKTVLGSGASRWAQGGVAAALGVDDRPELHALDTVAVSGGIGDPDIADLVASAAPARIRWLETIGAHFDQDTAGNLALGREAGHRARRIVHAGGDATGVEIMRALVDAVLARSDIDVHTETFAVDLIRVAGRVIGVSVIDADGRETGLLADAVVLATGGIGQVYARTTNPTEATGDGIAMAARVGALIRDPEFVQFHPTALETALDPKPLLTEALRGEGAHLLDHRGRRYMPDIHPEAELAPRDVVARANWQALRDGPIHLDCRMLATGFADHFPTVAGHASAAGLDPTVDLLPVTPVQHYHMGGVATDAEGLTSVRGLFACGEVAATGLHGANRLASNSLLEGLVFGTRIAEAIATGPGRSDSGARDVRSGSRIGTRSSIEAPAGWTIAPGPGGGNGVDPLDAHADAVDAISTLRQLMWDEAGLVRDAAGLGRAQRVLRQLVPALDGSLVGRNLGTVASLVIDAALDRRESRGGHFRRDHPGPVPAAATASIVAPVAVDNVTVVGSSLRNVDRVGQSHDQRRIPVV